MTPAKCWLDCGLPVDALIGHSFGQLTALCVAGSLSLADGLRLISERARLIQSHWGPEPGGMLAVEGSLQEVESLLAVTAQRDPSVPPGEIACYNGPRSFVLAGTRACIDAMERLALSERAFAGLKTTRLKNTHAFHSRLVDSILPAFTEVARTLLFKPPAIPIEACSLDQSWSDITPEKVVQQSRLPVYFAAAVERTARRLPSSIWLEAGSGSPVIAMARRVLQSHPATEAFTFLPIDIGSERAQMNLARATGELWAAGAAAATTQFWLFHCQQRQSYDWINLPPYQFQESWHWIDYKPNPGPQTEPGTGTFATKQQPDILTLLDDARTSSKDRRDALFFVEAQDDLFRLCTEGHEQGLCPASLYVELAARAASMRKEGQRGAPHVRRLRISSPLTAQSSRRIFLRLSHAETGTAWWTFTLFSAAGEPNGADTVTHATGEVTFAVEDDPAHRDRLRSLNRLVGKASRWNAILQSPRASSLTGAVIYKTFERGQLCGLLSRRRKDRRAGPGGRGLCVPASQPAGGVGAGPLPSHPSRQRPPGRRDSCQLPVGVPRQRGLHVHGRRRGPVQSQRRPEPARETVLAGLLQLRIDGPQLPRE